MRRVCALFVQLAVCLAGQTSWAGSVEQQLERTPEGWVYTVSERAPWLMMIARELYADPSAWREIAKWNGLSDGAVLSRGQRLRLERAPVTSPGLATAILIEQWRARGDRKMVARLMALDTDGRGMMAESGGVAGSAEEPKAMRMTHKPTMKRTIDEPTPKRSQQMEQVVESAEEESVVEGGHFTLRRHASAESGSEAGKEPKSESYWLGDSATELIETISRKLRDLETKK